MAGCLGEEAEKTGKGTGRERIWHSAQRCVSVCVCVGVNAREYRCSTERQGLRENGYEDHDSFWGKLAPAAWLAPGSWPYTGHVSYLVSE